MVLLPPVCSAGHPRVPGPRSHPRTLVLPPLPDGNAWRRAAVGDVEREHPQGSFLQLAWNADTCTRCGKCRKICPVDIRPDYKPASAECLRCLDCTRCPSLALTTVFHRNPFGIPKGEPAAGAERLSGAPAG
jgi:hypothetical protein